MALSFGVSRGERTWEGRAFLPWSYFPPGVSRFNAYAIHGSADQRRYEALCPIPAAELRPGQQPDFHRLEYFGPLSLSALLGQERRQPASDLWPPEEPGARRA
ncbi:UPF0462 protein C4orf33 [Galemys pyrenaicus]|uniref:UPF0462 protein C4orf33 n=1 Tax=Galemys pyrenaicus TaxID=202257 RepID=A0A8J5ZUK2_GALPY|nr:UPF0462 protein C4orf33 [Galemys pyrenaicus]